MVAITQVDKLTWPSSHPSWSLGLVALQIPLHPRASCSVFGSLWTP